MAPTVSIVIPCYNAELFIEGTLESVLNQTFADWECIIVDDASTDNSVEKTKSLCEGDSRFIIIEQGENGGAALARNRGLEEVKGRYLAFLDADDLWVEDKLESQIKFLKEQDADLVHSSYRFIDEGGNFLPWGVRASESVDLKRYMRNTEIGMSTSLIDLEKVDPFRLKNIRLCQDTNLWLELLSRGHISKGLDRVLVHYRVRDGQISGSKIAMAKQVFSLWMGMREVALHERLFSFGCYAVNGFKKRLIPVDWGSD